MRSPRSGDDRPVTDSDGWAPEGGTGDRIRAATDRFGRGRRGLGPDSSGLGFGSRVDQGPRQWAIRSDVIRWLIQSCSVGRYWNGFCNSPGVCRKHRSRANLALRPAASDPWEGNGRGKPGTRDHIGEF